MLAAPKITLAPTAPPIIGDVVGDLDAVFGISWDCHASMTPTGVAHGAAEALDSVLVETLELVQSIEMLNINRMGRSCIG